MKWKPIADLRLRYENVDQSGIADEANAITARLRAGLEATMGDFSVLGEFEGTQPLLEHYNSSTNGKTQYPLVADPRNAELNRLQVQYTGIDKTSVTAGRQLINIDDQRFVGSVGWRQNEQTFDAVRVESAALGPLAVDVTYAWADRTIFGEASAIQSIPGDNIFATVSADVDTVTIEGFAYMIDQDQFGRRQFSSKTFGVHAEGKYPLGADLALAFDASYARQSDWKNNPTSYDADYWLGDATLTFQKLSLTGAYEVLGADSGAPNTSFQTPLATGHKFQGWADKFLTTPANGVRDLNGTVGYALGKFDIVGPVKLAAVYHQFDSDIHSLDYGHEWDAQMTMKPRPDLTFITKYAHYTADKFATDTDKLWVEFDYSL
ncbi:MAG TPA: alginate export family protein [Parvibaculum sp.]